MSDINPGQSPNPNGSPITPATAFTGPLLAGNVQHSDGTGNLAALGGTQGTANVGYVEMCQTAKITQATNGSSAGVFDTDIVIPAQSQIVGIDLLVTTIWDGASPNLGIGSTASATALTTAGAVTTSGTVGRVSLTPGTDATAIANWNNTGSTDMKIRVTSTNTGGGVGKLTVKYIQGINNAT